MQYPNCIIAFAILRKSNGAIRSYAASRTIKGPDAHYRFELFYETFADEQGDDLLAKMCSLIPKGALVVGEVQGGEVSSGTEQVASIALPMVEEGALAIPNTVVLQGHEQQLEELAEAFGIPLADPDAPLVQQARRLADRAQALWLTYIVTHLGWRDRFQSLAAFCSYQESGAARPMPF